MAAVPEVRQIDLRTRSVFFDDTKRGRGRVKHSILQRFTEAWLPKMGYTNDLIVYVDGFAGPGKYVTPSGVEEPGSPLVVYRAALNHTHLQNWRAITHMFFIEKDERNAAALRASLSLEEVSDKVFWYVLQGSFAKVMNEVLLFPSNVPMFIFADPFGYSGAVMPMEIMQRLAHRPKTDLLINVMDSFALKWGVSQRRQEKTVSDFLGLDPEHWRDEFHSEHLSPEEKRERFMGLYKKQLQFYQGRYEQVYCQQFGVRRANNSHVYHLLFASKHESGIESIKYAMWKVTQESDRLVFSEYKENRGIMVDLPTLRANSEEEMLRLITKRFEGHHSVTGSDIAKFVLLDTSYEVKRRSLKRLLGEVKQTKARRFDHIVYEF